MSEGQTAPNLAPLHDTYEILGELRTGDRVGMFLGTRRSDGAQVTITVVHAPMGGENNALNHFAADTQLLAQVSHAHIPQVIEGRWVGNGEFAVVSKRYQTESLDELLARGETFTPPRISTILADVVSVLEWARTTGVVHRGITPDTLSFETGTNRVLVVLEPTPIPLEAVPDASADAWTVGTLAWAMFTGERFVEGTGLAELKPDLAKRVTDETDVLVNTTTGDPTPDVQTYLSVVAAADALRAGELEIAEMEAELLEARRTELAEFEAAQRAAAERNAELQAQLASERKEFERKMADEAAELARVSADFAQLKATEEGQLSAERAQLEHERDAFDSDQAAFEAQVMEREAELASKNAEVDRIRAEEGRRIDAAIAAAVETVAETAAAAEETRAAEAALAEETRRSEAATAANARPATKARERATASTSDQHAPVPEWIDETVRQHAVGDGEEIRTAVASRPSSRGWMIPVTATGVLIVLALVVGVMRQEMSVAASLAVGNSTVVPMPPSSDPDGTAPGGFLSQTAAGTVAPPAPAATAEVDSTSAPVPAPAVSAAAVQSSPRRASDSAGQRAGGTSEGASTVSEARADSIRRAVAARRDSVVAARRRDSLARRDSATPRGTARASSAGPVPDSVVRRLMDLPAARPPAPARDTVAKKSRS